MKWPFEFEYKKNYMEEIEEGLANHRKKLDQIYKDNTCKKCSKPISILGTGTIYDDLCRCNSLNDMEKNQKIEKLFIRARKIQASRKGIYHMVNCPTYGPVNFPCLLEAFVEDIKDLEEEIDNLDKNLLRLSLRFSEVLGDLKRSKVLSPCLCKEGVNHEHTIRSSCLH